MRQQHHLTKFEQWHQTRVGLVVMGLIELLLAYGVGSRAISTGSYWEYGLTLILFIGGINNVIKLIKTVGHGHQA